MDESLHLITLLNIVLKLVFLLILNLGVGAIGFVPSFLITAININTLGLVLGAVLTFTGEIFGALIGFHLYRWGFSKIRPKWLNNSFFKAMRKSSPTKVFILIIIFRVLPFVPSGLVTGGASLTTISGVRFMIASSIGKIPAVILEVGVVFGILQKVSMNYLYIFFTLLLIIITPIWIKNKKKTLD